ncbi:P-loop NTPase fold protein [Candidatus Hepatoplasma crinochetorum]|uniref:P-loop NTPase fold protein n=1 Tax=Candidatus Hepatoplasma crinochetorum TaxID=295596 RepID=UPI00308B412B|nr:MAG: hypothetical protein HCTKY_5190 [Candidatus Hepatoplasma crinochetorum]
MENFIVNKGYSINLIVKEDDEKLIDTSNEFILELEKEYFKYKNKLKKEQNKFEKYNNNKHVYFSQEKLLKKSPLAIINAPWGSGKTYFIEQLAKNFIDQKIDIKNFKNIIILDIFKFSNTKNIPDEIIAELFFILTKIYDQDNKNDLLNKLHKFAIKFFNATVIAWINYFGKFNFEKFKIKDLNETEIIVNEISKSIEPTLIIFDNIERIGKYSWEILKAIFKISQIDNFCFILPMNINRLNGNENKKNDEYPIEKYIDLPIFEFKQDYLSFLKNNGVDQKDAIIINNILNTEIDGQKLSIREVEQRFNKNDIFKENNKYLKLDKIVKNVWGSVTEAKKYLNDEIKKYIENLNQLEAIFNQIKLNIKERKYQNINFDQDTKNYINQINNNSWNLKHNYEEWIIIFDKILKDIKEYLNKFDLKKIELITTKEKLNSNYPIINNNLRILNLKLEKEMSLEDKDNLKINQLQIEIEKQINNIEIIKNQINLINQKIYNIEEGYKDLDYKNLEKSIQDYKEKVKSINQDIDLYLINKYYMWDRKFDYSRDNSNYIDYFIDCLFS